MPTIQIVLNESLLKWCVKLPSKLINVNFTAYGIGIDQYGSSRYRYRYMFLADTDIMGQRYWPPICWPISRIFNRNLADTDIADIYLADTDTDTDMPIPISSLPIPIYRYWPNISDNR